MINQWDIISSIRTQDNAILYALVIDGTEHDARLIAKKLKGYVQDPQPADAPYVYRFDLPVDLDEDTLEKIRVAVKEGIEQAKKVNEFIPGGAFGNPLFTDQVTRDDKDFPTFITLDPSESFFGGDPENKSPNMPLPPGMWHTLRKAMPDEDEPLEEIDNAGYRSDPSGEPTPPTPPDLSGWEEEAQPDGLTSVESQEEWPDTLPKDIHLQMQVVPSKTLPGDLIAQIKEKPEEKKKDEEEEILTANDVFSTNRKNALPEPALEDIFSAETKYDMFLDAEKLQAPGPVKTPATAEAFSQQPKTDHTAAEEFNIFEQKIKDQTCFMDLDDANTITDRIAKKDLSFVQHAQTAQTMPQKKTETAADGQTGAMPPSPFFRHFEEEQAQDQNVMDPFEQLLASANNTQPASGAAPSTQTEVPTGTLPSAGQDKSGADDESQPQEREENPLPSTQNRENIMTVNNGENKPTSPSQNQADIPQAPAAPNTQAPYPPQEPQTQQPLPPAAPAQPGLTQPLPPASAVQQPLPPATPVPPAPAAPAVPSAAPQAPAEEKQRTILRRRTAPSVNTTLEKTHTIDHSIELPLSELKKHNWPLEVPLVPTYTLENTLISVNRFAHATAISVIDNPGKLYNPLVLHGASGTGKTHFLHAIGYELSKKFGQENIFITNGVRLSRGVQRYMMEGNIHKLEEFMQPIKALLIDDIHLLAINEQNRAYLSKLLSDFNTQQKQIVMTSKYPPESLAKLEELLNFRLDSGWISELKPASGASRNRLIRKILNDNSIDLTEKTQEQFFSRPGMTLGTVVRSIRRVRVLEKLIFPDTPQANRSAENIFDLLLANTGEDRQSLISTKDFNEPISASVLGNGEWGRIGFFYPQNHSDKMNWMLFAIQQRAKELGIEGGLELAVRSSYSTENIISSAFKIANLCDNKKLKGAVILGPDLDSCDRSVRENFYDILTHMLEIMLIRCGVINYEDVNLPSTYVKVLSELLR